MMHSFCDVYYFQIYQYKCIASYHVIINDSKNSKDQLLKTLTMDRNEGYPLILCQLVHLANPYINRQLLSTSAPYYYPVLNKTQILQPTPLKGSP